MDERCETCRYLYSGFVDMCRRYPPQVVLIEGASGRVGPTSVFPRIEWPKAEWCGEYQPSDKPIRRQTSDDKTPATSINWTTREANILTDICGNLLGLSLSGATLQDLSAITVRDLRETRNCGEATTSQIVHKLKFAGVELKED